MKRILKNRVLIICILLISMYGCTSVIIATELDFVTNKELESNLEKLKLNIDMT